MAQVQCQVCGELIALQEASFFGPPSAITWQCKSHPPPKDYVGRSSLKLDTSYPTRRTSPIGDPQLVARQPIAEFSPPQVVEAIGTQVADIHRLRFELAHIIQYYDKYGVPSTLEDWYAKVKELLRVTNKGEAWDVER